MPQRLFHVFGEYNTFSKSIPGVVLIVGTLVMLPSSVTLGEGFMPTQVVATLLIFLVVGVIIGQGIHTLATAIERIVAWWGDRLSGIGNIVLDFVGSVVPKSRTPPMLARMPSAQDLRDGDRVPDSVVLLARETYLLVRKVLSNWRKDVVGWAYRRYWGINDTFKNHRVLFTEELQWYLSPYRNRRRADETHITKQRFVDAVKDSFDVKDKDLKEGDQVYTLVMSEIAASERQRAQQMHALYAFCRSMWVVLFVLTSVYVTILTGYVQPFAERGLTVPEYSRVFDADPMIVTVLAWTDETTALYVAIVGSLLSMFVFMAGASLYKKHFVEYIFTEYYLLTEAEEEP